VESWNLPRRKPTAGKLVPDEDLVARGKDMGAEQIP